MPSDEVKRVLDAIPIEDWVRWRVPNKPLDPDDMLAPDDAQLSTSVPDAAVCGIEDDPAEDASTLRELDENGDVWLGGFGDGSYVPEHWWSV